MAKFREMVEGQSGDIAMLDTYTDPSWHPAASIMSVNAGEAGVVKSIDALSTLLARPCVPQTWRCLARGDFDRQANQCLGLRSLGRI